MFTATLTVTDNKGATATDTAVITVGTVASTNWSKDMGGVDSDSVSTVSADWPAGNTYVAGTFNGTITIGTTHLTSAGASDAFLAKYAPNGTVLWAERWGGTGGETGNGVTVDPAGNVDIVGRFNGTANFGGAPVLVATPAASGGASVDLYVAQYDGATGADRWSKRFGGGYDDSADAVAVDSTGNVYFTGYFRNVIDFGGGPLSVPFTSDLDVFVAKFTADGAYTWAKNFTNTGNDHGYGIAVDGQENVAIGGSFSNAINFGGGDLVSPNVMTDAFVADFSTTGAYRWQRDLPRTTSSEGVRGVAVDGSGQRCRRRRRGHEGIRLRRRLGGRGVRAGSDGFVAKLRGRERGIPVGAARSRGTGNDYAKPRLRSTAPATCSLPGRSRSATAELWGQAPYAAGKERRLVAQTSRRGRESWVRGYGGKLGRLVQRSFRDTPGTGANPVLVGGYFYGSGMFEGTTQDIGRYGRWCARSYDSVSTARAKCVAPDP